MNGVQSIRSCSTRSFLPAKRRISHPASQAGFTMIEIMVVVALIALVMSAGIPFLYHSLNKDPMRQAVDSVMDACANARAAAILTGNPAKLSFNLDNRSLQVGQASKESAGARFSRSAASTSGLRIPEEVVIEMLDVNFQEMKDEPGAQVNFFPNGTSDEFTIVLYWPDQNDYRKISLDIVTGLAIVESVR